MWNLIFTIGAAAIGGLLGYAISSAISKYLDKAKEWFNYAWKQISRITRAVGILVRREYRLFKVFVVETYSGEVELYEQQDDEGVEFKQSELSDEVREALFCEDGYIAIETYE